MFGNGLKRKLDEDVSEDDRRPAAPGGASQASFSLQRQTLLNVSLMKLYGPRTGADLGLQRRVLINNVIRRIHDDFRREGGAGALFFSAAPPVAPAAAAHEDESFRPPSPPPSAFSILSSPLSGLTAPDSCLTPASLLEEELPVFFTPPPPSFSTLHHSPPRPPPPSPSPSPKDSFSSALEEIEELCPSSSSSSTPPPPAAAAARVLFDVVMKEEGRGLKEAEGRGLQEAEDRLEKPRPPPASASAPGSFLTDFALDDVLFTDIDTSMYDLGPCTPPSGAPPTKMAGAQNPPFKMDLVELDHIMEVLVGS